MVGRVSQAAARAGCAIGAQIHAGGRARGVAGAGGDLGAGGGGVRVAGRTADAGADLHGWEGGCM